MKIYTRALIALAMGGAPASFAIETPAPKPCATCSLATGSVDEDPGQGDICENLMQAVCVRSDGQPRKQIRNLGALEAKLKATVAAALLAGAQGGGFHSVDEAIRAALKAEGIDVSEPVDQKAWDRVFNDAPFAGLEGNYAEDQMFKASAACPHFQYRDLEEDKLRRQVNDAEHLATRATQAQEILTQVEQSEAHMARADLPKYWQSLSTSCQAFTSRGAAPLDANDKLLWQQQMKICPRFAEVQQRAVDLYRQRGSPNYDALVRSFVREFPLPQKSYVSETLTKFKPTLDAMPAQQRETASDLITANETIYKKCHELTFAIHQRAQFIAEQTREKLAKAKPTVDFLVQHHFTAERKANLEVQMAEIRQNLQTQMLSKLDPSHDIKLDQVQLNWLEPLPNSYYKLDPVLKVPVLAVDPIDPAVRTDQVIPYLNSDLHFFSSLNSVYSPDLIVGDRKIKQSLLIAPSFLELVATDPAQARTFLSRFVSSTLSPSNSRSQGRDLAPAWKGLLTCFQDSQSIAISSSQADEASADYGSAVDLAQAVASLPTPKRRPFVIAALKAFCSYNDQNPLSFFDDVPNAGLRVNGIYGGNPDLRAAINCPKASQNYKLCGVSSSAPSTDTIETHH